MFTVNTLFTASEDSRPYVTVQAAFRILQRIPHSAIFTLLRK